MLSFGVTVLPDPPYTRLVELMQLAEQHGFEYGWTYDSHILWQDPYPLLTATALSTSTIKLGVNVQLADPEIVEWIVGQVRVAAEGAGRDPAEIRVVACAPAVVSEDVAAACEQVRWFPAMVSNHVFDLLSKHDKSELPAALTEYVERMQREGYDYSEHSRVGAEHGRQVSDETCERFF